MKIHEYQAKELLRGYGVAVPRGKLVNSQEEAVAAARELMASGNGVVVVKAQIHAGGRGKGGGVKLARSPEEAGEVFKKMMGMQLVTHQTGPQGQKVRKVYVEEGCDIARELYLGITLDRTIGRNLTMASSEGGVEIEEVAAKHPEKILRAAIDPVVGLAGYQARNLAFGLGLKGSAVNGFVSFATAMYRADEEDPREAQAKEHDLSYVGLEGNIGCMVNGAGLAMSTMDMIKLAGGQPANFLDV